VTAPPGRAGPRPAGISFGRFVADSAADGQLVVQPRMGFGDARRMRLGLQRTKFAAARTVGTLTLDSYTRLGDHAAVRTALTEGMELNGYPIVDHPAGTTRAVLDADMDESFPVQVRHGSSRPERIIRACTAAGLDATEGGPVSYCLPYGRTPLRESVDNWARGCELLARLAPAPRVPHLESFGGCMLGQLCPPGLLVAISVLEALFFTQHGLESVSVSYAQQADPVQDEQAVRALRRLAAEFLPPQVDRHVVLYTYMGVSPVRRAAPGGCWRPPPNWRSGPGRSGSSSRPQPKRSASPPSGRTSRPSRRPPPRRRRPGSPRTANRRTTRRRACTARPARSSRPSSNSATTSAGPCRPRSAAATSTSRTACIRTTPAGPAVSTTTSAGCTGRPWARCRSRRQPSAPSPR
jgi:Methylaspartate mutase E chain (MutE)